jgi:hypothetical protein
MGVLCFGAVLSPPYAHQDIHVVHNAQLAQFVLCGDDLCVQLRFANARRVRRMDVRAGAADDASENDGPQQQGHRGLNAQKTLVSDEKPRMVPVAMQSPH